MSATTEAPQRTDVVLRGTDVAVHFGGVKAVDGLSFALETGRIFGILGPNGSGKSTLLAAITRLIPLTRGRLEIDGQDLGALKPAKLAGLGVARTFQTVRLQQELTVRENIQLGADSRSTRAGSVRTGVDEAIARTGLQGLEEHLPGELSYGTQRRVEIARALAMSPRLLLLDEPTAGMNKTERAEISTLLRELRAEGLTQLLVEHDVQMMVETCDHILAMNFGKLIAEGTPGQVVRNEAVQDAYLGRKWRDNAGDR
ncbi:ATP-binding cassette domain-containing protein [Nakamurella sp. YIM 132087]|uniref:ATP-binding cassette domain-containing protein n=1 Tax=Nakamurella alba TaxID=2665158 RepID=A0A7K1FH38_9ACTN|nr:ABC transporter ATP-binding protein [Nakamurella alba]MTD13418.1 ATP-binding cassette domain-containing protein [Nakamurella alba]